MGRRAQGWTIRPKGEIYYVRFRHAGRRHEITTGESDAGQATERAAMIYADVVTGRQAPPTAAASPSTAASLLVAEWLVDTENTIAKSTRPLWRIYGRHFLKHFKTAADFAPATIGKYTRARLGEVKRETVTKELSALRSFFRWAKEQGHMSTLLEVPGVRVGVLGTKATTRKDDRTDVSPDQCAAVLRHLPDWSSAKHPRRFPVAPYFRVLWETGLRPATVKGIECPTHYTKGARELRITDEIDKGRFGRTVPLTAAATAALDGTIGKPGPIFGRHDYRGFLRAAAKRAGLPAAIGDALVPYDLRHNRTTHLLEDTGNLPGVAFLVGHTKVTTTNGYARLGPRAARNVLGEVSGEARKDSCEGRELNPYASNGASTSSEREGPDAAESSRQGGQQGARNRSALTPSGPLAPLAKGGAALLDARRDVDMLSAGWDRLEFALLAHHTSEPNAGAL